MAEHCAFLAAPGGRVYDSVRIGRRRAPAGGDDALILSGGDAMLERCSGALGVATAKPGYALAKPGARLGAAALAVLCAAAFAADWPQLGNGPKHLGYSPEDLNGPFRLKWNVQFQPERLYPAMQPVVVDGRVFLGTEGGRFHALDAASGKRVWQFPAGRASPGSALASGAERVGPVLHTAGVEAGKVFFASMDGCVYALEAKTGKLAWKFNSQMRTGFSTAVLLADGKIFAANRGGTFFALSQADGTVAWKADTGCALLQSPACSRGRVYVAGMDMRLRALDVAGGKEVWKSGRMAGLAFKDYWPVVYRGLVIVRPMGGWETHFFDEKTGKPAAITLTGGVTMNGAVAPPCVDFRGKLVTSGGLKDTWQSGWCRFDLDTRKLEQISTQKGGRGNRDENMTPSAAGRLIFVMHCEEGNAQFTGFYDLRTKAWTRIRGGPWRNMTSNTQGGGASQAVAAAGAMYHVSLHGLRCFEGRSAR